MAVRSCTGFLILSYFCVAAYAQTWERLGPEGGNVISLAVSPDGTVFLGAADGHIYASKDAAAHWELRGRAGARLDGVVQHLLVDARSPQRVFAALWFQDPAAGGGIFRSEDGARTWQPSGLRGEAVRTLEQSRSQPEIFIAGTRTGIFRSNDSGTTWERISPEGNAELRNIDSLAIDPSDSRVIYAGTYHLPWKTTDGGKSWRPIAGGMIDDSDVMSLHIDAKNPARIFASACSGIYRSENGGATWIKLQGIPYASRRTQSIAQDPRETRTLYAGTTEGLWLSRDAGETWTRASPREWVINSVSIIASAASGISKIILGTEAQGILVSEDSASNFSPSNAGFSHRVVAALVGDARDPLRLLARISDSGVPSLFESRDAGKSWHVLPAEAPSAGIEKLFATESGWWASLAGGGVARYDNASSRWLALKFSYTATPRSRERNLARSLKPQAAAPKHDPQVYDIQVSQTRIYIAAADGLWSGELANPLLRRMASAGIIGLIRSFTIAPGGSEFWAVTGEKIFHSTDAGKTWTNEIPAATPGPLLWVRALSAAEGPSLIFGAQVGVYRRSLDPGAPWQLLQSGLPAAATETLWNSANLLAITAKNGGLYLSVDNGKTWQRLDTPREEGIFTGIADDGRGGIIAGSRTEGILHWVPASLSK